MSESINKIMLADITKENKKLAWGITGAGHLLKESVEKISELFNNGYSIDIYFSRAGKEVIKIFNYISVLNELKKKEPDRIKLIFADNQGYSFPVCGKFSLKSYDCLIVSPTTGNTVAKLSYKIADTLITNIVSQALKGKTPVIIIPTDYKIGPCKTITPDKKEITIYIHESDVERTKDLMKIKGIYVIEKLSDILV